MDPIALLLNAMNCLDDGDTDIAIDMIRNYRDWRAKGGFDPDMPANSVTGTSPCTGDEFADRLDVDLYRWPLSIKK